MKKMKFMLINGKLTKVPASTKADYSIPSTATFFSPVTNLIPGVSSVSGARVLIGEKSSTQAMTLINREVPLVQSSDTHSKSSFNSIYGRETAALHAKDGGTVTKVDPEGITVKTDDGENVHHELYNNYLVGRESYLHNTPVVKKGDKVSKGELMATSNYSDKAGKLALGMNLKTAVMPFRSYNFEDALVISEDAAKKLEAEQLVPIRLEIARGIETDKDRYVSLFPNKYLNDQLDTIDSAGVVKTGTKVKNGDPVILAFQPKTIKSLDLQLGKLSRVLRNAFSDISSNWEYEHDGEVVDVSNTGKLVTVTIKTTRPMGQADKLCLTTDHEVLTEYGWRLYADIPIGTRAYSRELETGNISLEPVEAIPVYLHAGKMYSLSTSSVDMCVTLNHKLVANRRKGWLGKKFNGKYELIPAEKLVGKNYKLVLNGSPIAGIKIDSITLPGAEYTNGSKGVRTSPSMTLPAEAYFALVGLFVSEGNLVNDVKSGSFGIDIAQSKYSCVQKITELFDKHAMHYIRGPHGFRIYSKALYTHFKQFGSGFKSKQLPDFLFKYDHSHLQTIFDWAMLGDGHVGKTCMFYFTSSELLRDSFQRLVVHLGKSSTYTPRGYVGKEFTICGKATKQTAVNYAISIYCSKFYPEINHSHTRSQKAQHEALIDYAGPVFCLTLPKHHTFYVRRNGKAHWTGNSNAYGAKGVVRIIPNTEMPQGEDGKPVDVILNSMSVTSRVAPGLINSLALGKVAQKLGHPLNMNQFTEGSSVEKVIAELDKHGISDTEKLYDPQSGKHIDVMVGPAYYTRLHHIAEDKISSRSAATTYDINQQPSKSGTDEKSKRLGNLATTVALSNDAKAVLRDIATIRATKNDEYWTALKLGYPTPPPKVPFIFNKFVGHLKGAGVNMVQDGNLFNIFPQTDKDITAMSAGPIKKPLTYKLKKDDLIAEDGGLFDASTTGIYGDNYNHIDLAVPMPNPISEDYIRKMLKLTKVKFEEKLASGELEKELRGMDIDQKLEETKGFIKKGNKSGRDDALKVHAFLKMLKEHKIAISDLLLTKVPVIPAQFRPILVQGDQVMSADINELYKDLMLVNGSLRENKGEDISPEHEAQAKKKLYEGIKAVYGLGDPVSVKSKEKGFKGLLASALGLRGGSAKESMFQAKVVNKPIDLVGRGVLVPDANLALNEASIPQNIAWNIFSPFIIRRLVRQGIPAIKAREYVEKRHELAAAALEQERLDRPGIITRDPQLSKYNFQGFYLKPNIDPKDFSLKMNPLVFKGYGADSDGDQLNIQLPASDEAKEEIKEKLLPEKNLIYHRNFTPIFTPSNESATGLFQSSFEDKKNKAVKYSSEQEVVRDFFLGKLDIGDRVEIK